MTNPHKYGRAHKLERRRWVDRIRVAPVPCYRCGKLIKAGDPFDLGHNDAGTDYTGPECPRCNRADGGRRRHIDTSTIFREW